MGAVPGDRSKSSCAKGATGKRRTLFFVPKALHIYLWKQFWERYGRAFNFTRTFEDMPESLHAWFMNMFKFAGDAATAHVIDDILRPDGVFAKRETLTSAKGSIPFYPGGSQSGCGIAATGGISRQMDGSRLLDFKQDRQNLVWALEKIAVWPTLTARAIQVLVRLAANENADFSNNATGTFNSAASVQKQPLPNRLPKLGFRQC